MDKIYSLLGLLGADLVVVLLFAAGVGALSAWRRPAYAVLKRNFLAYFTSPIGYVFLCLFVWLAAVAAFWSDDFFNSNLANLDQLNRHLPLILLVFIPAITMSIWSEERRQGTDELLLTIPATDADIVLGKYLAAVAIFSVSLLFSQICNYLVLASLGRPDAGLLLGNYLGYWLAGLAMLAIGMVASFLTRNLTVGFVLGVLLNVPLVAAGYAEVAVGPRLGRVLARWSISEQFADFQGGVISLASVLFFLMVAAVMFYVSMVLIGRRHWSGGRDGHSMGGHFAVRSLSLLTLVAALCVLFNRWDLVRADVTSERLNTLHPDTRQLLQDLDPKYPIHLDAYVSRDLPEEFVEKRIDLGNVIREINSLGGGHVQARLHTVDLFGDEAARAKAEYGIDTQEVMTEVRGAKTKQNVIFGFGARSGLERVTVPFVGLGSRPEYELVRALVSVGQPKGQPGSAAQPQGKHDSAAQPQGKPDSAAKSKRKRVGVLQTDMSLFSGGGMPLPSGEPRPDQPLIQELRRQYQVVKVDPNEPITESYHVLLAPQPSSLSPQGMKNFIDAVRRGQPTAIFEDPFPITASSVPGTTAPKRPQGPSPFGMPMPEQKGDIQPLWDLLGVRIVTSDKPRRGPHGMTSEAHVVWQDYNPHEADRDWLEMTDTWVFVTPPARGESPFDAESPIVSGLQEVMFLYPGALEEIPGVNRKYTKLIRTDRLSGTMEWQDAIKTDFGGEMFLKTQRELQQSEKPSAASLVLAAHVYRPAAPGADAAAKEQKPDAERKKKGAGAKGEKGEKGEKGAKGGKGEKGEKGENEKESGTGEDDKLDHGLNVVVVADIDVLSGIFFNLRNIGDEPRNPIHKWNLDNVPLVLNVIDVLAGDTRFVNIRKRRPRHRELTAVSSLAEDAKKSRRSAREEATNALNEAVTKEESKLNEAYDAIRKRVGVEAAEQSPELAIAMSNGGRRLQQTKAELERKRDEKFRAIDDGLAAKIQTVQDRYKMWAVLLPPIPPLLIALCVFLVRQSREREGVGADRLLRGGADVLASRIVGVLGIVCGGGLLVYELLVGGPQGEGVYYAAQVAALAVGVILLVLGLFFIFWTPGPGGDRQGVIT